MDNQLEQIIVYLQGIQGDIVGIIIPAIITATVAMISLFINSFISIIQEKVKYNHEQFKYMQKFFPNLKDHLQQMRLAITLAKGYSHSFNSSLPKALQNYHAFKIDESSYRSNHPSEVQELDKFIYTIEGYVDETIKLHDFFTKAIIPAMPLLHPFLRKRILEMLKTLQYWSHFLQKLKDTSINEAFFAVELDKCNLDDEQLQKYIELLDKWYQAY